MGFLEFGDPKVTQTQQTTTMDPATQAYIDQYRRMAMGSFGQAGANPWLNQYGQQAGQLAQQGLGYGMQQGLQGIEGFMNPYLGSVIGAMNPLYDQQRAIANRAAGDMATRAGAFGGSREAVLRGTMMNDVNQQQQAMNANLLNSGFQNAAQQLMAQRAMQAQMGMGGLQGLYNTGLGFGNLQQGFLGAMQGGMQPFSTTTNMRNEQSGSFWGDLLGAGTALAGMGLF
jgi:hypothetical protein